MTLENPELTPFNIDFGPTVIPPLSVQPPEPVLVNAGQKATSLVDDDALSFRLTVCLRVCLPHC